MAFFTKEESNVARHADLAGFLLRTDPGHYVREGQSIRLIDPSRPKKDRIKGVSIKMGKSWWHDFSTGESGNCVEYLTDRMGYTLVDAIKALAEYSGFINDPVKPSAYSENRQDAAYNAPQSKSYAAEPISGENTSTEAMDSHIRDITLPEPTDARPRQAFGYLGSRGIPSVTISQLMKAGLLYQSKDHNNLVFVNRDRDFAELRGTYTYGSPFHGVKKTGPDRFWSFSTAKQEQPQKAYVCESAIDAISLYLLHQKGWADGSGEKAMYVSLAGVANQQTIDRMKVWWKRLLLPWITTSMVRHAGIETLTARLLFRTARTGTMIFAAW